MNWGGGQIGFAGRVMPARADQYRTKKSVWTVEIRLNALQDLQAVAEKMFRPLPVFPPVRRDITFIAQPGVTAAAVCSAVESLRLPLLSGIRLIDCYEPDGKAERNLTIRLTFRHKERTLKDSEADKQRDQIAAAVQKALEVRI